MNWFYDPAIRKVIALTLLLKLLALAVITAGAFFLPFHARNYLANFHDPLDQASLFWSRFKTWDAQHYLFLARMGYKPLQMSNAFYPLFPLLIRCLSLVSGLSLVLSGFILSTLFTTTAAVFLYKLVRELYDETLAWNSSVLLLVFPMGFFLGFIYADSLFLMLAVLFFYGWFKGDKASLFLAALLLPWVKPIGILLSPILLLLLCFKEYRPRWVVLLMLMAVNGLGFWLYTIYMSLAAGDPWTAFAAQQNFLSGYSVASFLHPLDWFMKNFVELHWTLNGPLDGALSRLMFLAFIPLLVLVYQRMDPIFFIYTLVMGLASAFSGDLMSFPRYWLGLFPLFIVLSMELQGVRRLVWMSCWLTQVIFILLYSVNDWAA